MIVRRLEPTEIVGLRDFAGGPVTAGGVGDLGGFEIGLEAGDRGAVDLLEEGAEEPGVFPTERAVQLHVEHGEFEGERGNPLGGCGGHAEAQETLAEQGGRGAWQRVAAGAEAAEVVQRLVERAVFERAFEVIEFDGGELLVREVLVAGEEVAKLERIDEVGVETGFVGGGSFAVGEQLGRRKRSRDQREPAEERGGGEDLGFAQEAALRHGCAALAELMEALERGAELLAFGFRACAGGAIEHRCGAVPAVDDAADDRG